MNNEHFKELFCALLSIDSTTGYYEEMQEVLIHYGEHLGFKTWGTRKGGVIVEVPGEGDPLCVTAHADTIGLIVRHINADGTLKVVKSGGLHPNYALLENVRIHTRDGKVYTGTVQRTLSSVHVSPDKNWQEVEDYATNTVVVIDEDVHTAEETRALGIEVGDFIALEPRPVFTESGYVKSRFIDDKAMLALCLMALEEIREKKIVLPRKTYFYFAMYEEVGHGTSYLPEDTADVLAVDIAVTGPEQTSTEKTVSIFAGDSRFPYHYGFANELIAAAKACSADYRIDVFTPHYGSDGDTSVVAGHDVRHACIGPGTACSHGYERTHIDGLSNTYALLMSYLQGGAEKA